MSPCTDKRQFIGDNLPWSPLMTRGRYGGIHSFPGPQTGKRFDYQRTIENNSIAKGRADKSKRHEAPRAPGDSSISSSPKVSGSPMKSPLSSYKSQSPSKSRLLHHLPARSPPSFT
ncbi:hypothetical protein PoB_006891800 [Plakobranchus ocellatus]|uniref:Uncharacterized protein n=1 Tax=Plakobranchus ocellatus TaxID=259542 RepID=A0AAV4DEE1_9GAST|nr:hypothetical protein PoB_006891800 [Plakobranchus ocellatus]